jgi:hypothetical protein
MREIKLFAKRFIFVSVLFFLLLAGFLLPMHAQGQLPDWQTVSDPSVEITQSNPLYHRPTRTYRTTVTVINQSGADIPGEFRIVVDSSNKTAQNPNGTTGAGEPYFNLLTGEGSVLQAGQTLSLDLIFAGGRGRLIYTVRLENKPLVVSQPGIQVTPATLDFGDVVVGSSVTDDITVSETGNADLEITDIQSSSALLSIFPPTAFTIIDGGPARTVSVGFAPTEASSFTGTITVVSNTGTPVTVDVIGQGVDPQDPGDISAPTSLEFGSVEEEVSVDRTVTVSNSAPVGSGSITVSGASTDTSEFELLPPPANSFPFVLNPNESRNLTVRFTPT